MKPEKAQTERRGLVYLESWAGRSAHRVAILRETPKRIVCRWEDLPAFRHAPGDIIRAPKYAVRMEVADGH